MRCGLKFRAFVALVMTLAMGAAARGEAIGDKTLVAWVKLGDLDQRGGSALTIDHQDGRFDGIVFGEIRQRRWMAGSNFHQRTQREQDGYAQESAAGDTFVQIAIVYEGDAIRIYRNGQAYAAYETDHAITFGDRSVVVMGLRHIEAGDGACLAGEIEDARVYDRALTAAQIAALKADESSRPEPLAWWTFEDGHLRDRMGLFSETLLIGGAYARDGKLMLDGEGSYLVAARAGQGERWLASSAAGSAGGERIAAARAQRALLVNDRHRPGYHFVAPEGHSMPFDPNGAIYWQGRYHLFYIFQNELGHCWGHASSADLVHWRFHPPGLVPAAGDPDRGIFSGNAFVNKDGAATILYHGVGVGNCIATSDEPLLINWTKLDTNPIVPSPKQGDPDFGKFRSWDPHGWVEAGEYVAIFGGNPATIFKAGTLRDWRYVGPFLAHDMSGVDADEDISCPDFFKLGDEHMLLCISHKRGARYYLGRWDGKMFHPRMHARMNWAGGTCFAPESLVDDRGRRIMWAWVLDRRPMDQIQRAGWSGVMTLPRVLSMGEDGTLRIAPVEELEKLRLHHRGMRDVRVAAGSALPVDGVSGDSMEISLEVDLHEAKRFGVEVRRSPDGAERTVIEVDAAAKTLAIDVSHSSLDESITHQTFVMHGGANPRVTRQEAPFEVPAGEPLRLRIFLDRSIVEVFANERQCITQRIYPTRADSVDVRVFAEGGDAIVRRLNAWDMVVTNPW